MFSNHISDLSSAYWHNELTPEQSRQVAEHLASCAHCRAEFAEVKLGIRFAEQLESVSAPSSLWPRIAAGLSEDSAPSRRLQFLKPLALTAAIVLAVGTGIFLLRRPHVDQVSGSRQVAGWRVARLGGSPRIGSESINDQGRLDWMQWTIADVVNPAPSYFDPLGPDYVQHLVPMLKQYETVGLQDPTVGFYSETAGRQGLIAGQRFGDGITDIVAGRRPLSDLDSLVSEWRSNGGDQVRQEYLDAMAAA